jgi:hypothetical protein
MTTNHAFVNSDPSGFDSNCVVCGGKDRDSVHGELKIVHVYFDNGDSLVTGIRGTQAEILEYYIGQTFNLGRGDQDLMATATRVEFKSSQA